ncbi:PREDICTED: probable ribonuclease ZC3H12C isoform X1 [Acromyrmex echinatior]|uniref:Putative ribonuclease ZC3H12B n=1 Tax=Acromyrmex echinatior TaxID=103372 RepID=F4WJ77_ACREC|nr:PREDICTED: probable ribonuclease ZC3H12C isoform X1 [Acromyrmex echinatior]EGI65655.1 Putative ribonuclease ZC3H12B [Acromyrmex echinatior]
MKRKKSLSRQESRYCYNSPLNVFRKSMVNLTSLINEKMVHKDRRLSDGMRKLNKQNAADSSKRIPSRNSVIVINDSDSERDDRNEDASLSIVECSSIPTSPFQQNKKLKTSTKKNTNKSSVSLDNDSSVLCLTDMQENLNEESIAPSQTEDDVVELWSCLNSLNVSKDKKNKKRKREKNANKNEDVRHNFDETNEMFVIDKTPNLKYLKFLRDTDTDTDTFEYIWKRKKKQDLFSNKTTAKSFVKPKRSTLKCSYNSQRKRNRENWNPSPLKFNIRYSNKFRKEAEETQKNTDENNGTNSKYKLREIIVDGCNVAMNHTQGKEFSEKGIQIVVNYFKERGHVVKVFLPQHVRKKEHTFLEQLYKEGTVIFTPSRKIGGRQITSYDDRFILKYATTCGGIVISSDQYRDLYREKPEWRNTILNRLLIPTFVGDYIMFPEDPLGKFGPNLERFLRH